MPAYKRSDPNSEIEMKTGIHIENVSYMMHIIQETDLSIPFYIVPIISREISRLARVHRVHSGAPDVTVTMNYALKSALRHVTQRFAGVVTESCASGRPYVRVPPENCWFISPTHTHVHTYTHTATTRDIRVDLGTSFFFTRSKSLAKFPRASRISAQCKRRERNS